MSRRPSRDSLSPGPSLPHTMQLSRVGSESSPEEKSPPPRFSATVDWRSRMQLASHVAPGPVFPAMTQFSAVGHESPRLNPAPRFPTTVQPLKTGEQSAHLTPPSPPFPEMTQFSTRTSEVSYR